MTEEIDFQTGHSATLGSSKLIFILLTLGKSRLTLFGPLTDFGQVSVILLSLDKTCHEMNMVKN